MEIYHLNIAGVSVQLSMSWHIEMPDNFRPFLTHSQLPAEENFRFFTTDHFPAPAPDAQWQQDGKGEITTAGKITLRRLTPDSQPYMMEVLRKPDTRDFYFLQSGNELPLDMMKVFGEIGLEKMLLRHDCLILHSSLIRWQEKGILFSAPSGTGKSTQADLWAAYAGADILNGDRAALRKKNGIWHAYGIPVAGSSNIFRNESVPLTALVHLKQGPENILDALTPVQMLRRVYPEFTLHRWDNAFLEKGLALILDILQSVKIYGLTCRPDRQAVEILRNSLTSEVLK